MGSRGLTCCEDLAFYMERYNVNSTSAVDEKRRLHSPEQTLEIKRRKYS